jgi:hypothetical protein
LGRVERERERTGRERERGRVYYYSSTTTSQGCESLVKHIETECRGNSGTS